ncbi:hypothetical protein, partial [Endozoicomonas sp. SESOKO4]|uniref:hypothetical protein n=1 Tax=Endozoicomonas sp. SESOKO4 TaxID=2828745 RepID=UPI0021473075
MDGRIDGEVKKPVPGSGVPADAAKLELSSEKKVKICAELTSKLTLSSPPIVSPDTERAVSSTDSPLSGVSHSFDFRFVASDD